MNAQGKRVLVPLADGFEEIETVTVVDVLRRAGVEVITAGIKAGPLEGSRKVKVIPDTTLEQVLDQNFDALVLVGGQPGVNHLRADARVLALVCGMNEAAKVLGAVCAAPLILRDAGIIEGLNLTSHPGVEKDLSGCVYSEERVVIDKHRVTSRGPGTSMEFALALVKMLVSEDKAEELKRAMLVY
jgi:4-methyl-5(b-hydroxyethyl)-thiazole monophosphate biosynthesis